MTCRRKAAEYGFEPPDYVSDVAIPSGETLIEAQDLWKDKKDAGRPVYAVFVTDTSGSMAGSRITAVQQALELGPRVHQPRGIDRHGRVQRRRCARCSTSRPSTSTSRRASRPPSQDMDPVGGTAMYNGILLGLDMLVDQRAIDPSGKYMLVVLTDGETNEGLNFGDLDEVIAGARIPIFTVGFEADLEELGPRGLARRGGQHQRQ